ncbi:MAG: hypothetical protein RIQ50_713, partial [Bacteroidota bacterium]
SNDGQLFTYHAIHQGRFTHIGTSNDIYKTSFVRHERKLGCKDANFSGFEQVAVA